MYELKYTLISMPINQSVPLLLYAVFIFPVIEFSTNATHMFIPYAMYNAAFPALINPPLPNPVHVMPFVLEQKILDALANAPTYILPLYAISENPDAFILDNVYGVQLMPLVLMATCDTLVDDDPIAIKLLFM